MPSLDEHHHIVKAYDLELAHLRSLVVEMVDRVVMQTRNAVESIANAKDALARAVINRDTEVDTLSLAADDEVFRVIAKRQPTAIDLRLVLATARVVGDLERAGDKAERIAKHSLKLLKDPATLPLSKAAEMPLNQLTELTCELLKTAVTGLVDAKLDKAIEVFQAEARLRDARDAFRAPILDPAAGLTGDHFASLLTIAHALERSGNHANNIAEQAVYVITGQDVRFRNRELLIDSLRVQTDE